MVVAKKSDPPVRRAACLSRQRYLSKIIVANDDAASSGEQPRHRHYETYFEAGGIKEITALRATDGLYLNALFKGIEYQTLSQIAVWQNEPTVGAGHWDAASSRRVTVADLSAWRSRQYSNASHSMSQCTPWSAISWNPKGRHNVTDLPAACACAPTHSVSAAPRSRPRQAVVKPMSMTGSVVAQRFRITCGF
jgi:hypothetical protein